MAEYLEANPKWTDGFWDPCTNKYPNDTRKNMKSQKHY